MLLYYMFREKGGGRTNNPDHDHMSHARYSSRYYFWIFRNMKIKVWTWFNFIRVKIRF